MIVVDASVVVSAVVDDDDRGRDVRARLTGTSSAAPHLLDLEVVGAVRKLVRRGDIDARRGTAAVADLARLPVTRVAHEGLLARIWELRDNLTPYDAAYVALAELLDVALVTADARLAAAPGIRCQVEVLATPA